MDEAEEARRLFERGYRHHMQGRLSDAIEYYRRSIELRPTAEAHTFLGWAYSMLGHVDLAIEECLTAIEVDPTFGNPYNDIGAYLIEKGEWEEAIPWLEKATTATRYESPQFPHLNLGRVYERSGRFKTAMASYDKAIEIDPFYRMAVWAKFNLLGRMN